MLQLAECHWACCHSSVAILLLQSQLLQLLLLQFGLLQLCKRGWLARMFAGHAARLSIGTMEAYTCYP